MDANINAPDDLGELARRDRVAAHEEARRRVAEDPHDEKAALALRDLIRAFPPQAMTPSSDPLQGASPAVLSAAKLIGEGKTEDAEVELRKYLSEVPADPLAMRFMAQIAATCGFHENAYKILVRSLEIDRTRSDNWTQLGKLIHRVASKTGDLGTADEALAALDHAARLEPGHLEALAYKASILIQLRRLEEARDVYEELVRQHPEAPQVWSNYGYLLKTLGRFGEAVAAYRTSIALSDGNSEGYSGLANLKLARFFPYDLDDMEQQLEKVEPEGRVRIHIALAKAYDSAKSYDRAADHLRRGNALRLELHPYESARLEKAIDRAIKTYTPAYFAARSGSGEPSNAPIFILGMHRSGSTLVEQILSSHSMVEGTEELFVIEQLGREVIKQQEAEDLETAVTALEFSELETLGRRYLQLTRHYRRTGKPRFTDKYPPNWRDVGFIHSILPNAKIVDTRRNPMDCCFATYAQYFNWGVNFSSSQQHLGEHYSEYLRLMRHFDATAPGLVHRVIHEELVENFEVEVRRLLDYLDLPFEEECLRFFETDRPVLTPSSEQVRQPINKSGFGRWRPYEPELSELKESLGDALENWRS